MRHFLFFLISISLLSCPAGEKQKDPYVLWVNSSMASCVGRAPSKCLQVQKSDTPDPDAWESFHVQIKGFKFEPGYYYKILVKEDQVDATRLEADVPSLEYSLVEILEKKQDMKFLINGEWSLFRMHEQVLADHGDESAPPRLQIQVGEMRYTGNDGCNNYNGGIIELDEHSVRFGVAAATRMMCERMEIPDLYNASLPGIRTWEIKENVLYLFNAGGKEVMQFRKIDQ